VNPYKGVQDMRGASGLAAVFHVKP
jgi:hypothetical protein